MPKHIDFVVTCDPATARTTVDQVLTDRGFRLTWQDDNSATAERGSKAASFAAGAAAQYFNVGVHLMTGQPDETTVRLDRQSLSGAWLKGGALSPLRVSRNLASLRTELEGDFRTAGVLRSVSEG